MRRAWLKPTDGAQLRKRILSRVKIESFDDILAGARRLRNGLAMLGLRLCPHGPQVTPVRFLPLSPPHIPLPLPTPPRSTYSCLVPCVWLRFGRWPAEWNVNTCSCAQAYQGTLPPLRAGLDGGTSWRAEIARRAQRVTRHPDFESATLLLIAANCITLAMYNPVAPEDRGRNLLLNHIDVAFNALFTLEMLLRILSYGSLRDYFAVSWNLFDAIMVVAGYTQFLPTGSSGNTSGIRALRAMRALRPLRTIMRFSSLRSIIACFIEAVPLLMSVVLLLFFMLFLFAIAGMQLFQDAYHQTCVDPATGLPEPAQKGNDVFGCGWRACPAGYECRKLDRYAGSVDVSVTFDNIGGARAIALHARPAVTADCSAVRVSSCGCG